MHLEMILRENWQKFSVTNKGFKFNMTSLILHLILLPAIESLSWVINVAKSFRGAALRLGQWPRSRSAEVTIQSSGEGHCQRDSNGLQEARREDRLEIIFEGSWV